MATEVDQHLRQIQSEYLDFLDDQDDQGIYHQKVRDMVANNDVRIKININDLRRKNPKRCNLLLNESFEELMCFQRALKDLVSSADPLYGKQHEEFFVGFEGSFGDKHNTPRSLTSKFLGNMVCVEGIVTKCSLIRPKIVRSVHYCPATKKTIERRYADMTSLDAHPTSGVYPTKDEDGNLLETEFGLSVYKDHQTFSIQEMPEKSPPGQLPRSVDVIADNDLVDACKPGDRVQVVGMFRCLPAKKNGFTTATFRTVLIANSISLLSKEVEPLFSADDVAKIKKFAKDKKHDVFEALARSLAPSIHGHEYIKKAVLCMLLGGNEKVLENGTRLRGDINVLLIGDPSVAKSQMLRYVLYTAPRAIPTTGRGSSGVGLTAAVTTDQETGEKRLEAGAMVLADRGVVCIDEFDKMSDIDRTAIHEVMEQGRVTIAKAGIHAKLNARCSVLAAANPVYGRYDQFKTPMENIGLQDSLLSRFDLLFIVLDKMDPESDRQISDHVLRMHRYRSAGEQDGDVLPMGSSTMMLATQDPEAENTENQETPVYEKRDTFLHGPGKRGDKIVSMQFMRKYIHIAKNVKPILTRAASDYIAEEYAKLRNQDNLTQDHIARTQPVTARALETIIRLSTAHAKARLSKNVEHIDAQAAVELVEFAYFKKVLEREKKSRRRAKNSDGEESQDEEEVEKSPAPKKARTARAKKSAPKEDGSADPYDFEELEEERTEPASLEEERRKRRASGSAPSTPVSTQLSDERLKVFRSSLYQLYKKERAQSVQLDQIKAHMSAEHKDTPFSEDEIMSAIDKMMDENQVMLSDNIVFLV
ncbi:zygotic DNA replication licensing factor mcm3-like [Physella acuta]|uniref:zygotic DNA replication licensing factor mcm3-like n=1 Tax=Physella acuta TaxID=109671 RepID=UPI0027DDDABB|nr:zygotic DNA replication licensing factor mcm3-like [Physella acuta]